jgi:cell pole-organizing protein PopZ
MSFKKEEEQEMSMEEILASIRRYVSDDSLSQNERSTQTLKSDRKARETERILQERREDKNREIKGRDEKNDNIGRLNVRSLRPEMVTEQAKREFLKKENKRDYEPEMTDHSSQKFRNIYEEESVTQEQNYQKRYQEKYSKEHEVNEDNSYPNFSERNSSPQYKSYTYRVSQDLYVDPHSSSHSYAGPYSGPSLYEEDKLDTKSNSNFKNQRIVRLKPEDECKQETYASLSPNASPDLYSNLSVTASSAQSNFQSKIEQKLRSQHSEAIDDRVDDKVDDRVDDKVVDKLAGVFSKLKTLNDLEDKLSSQYLNSRTSKSFSKQEVSNDMSLELNEFVQKMTIKWLNEHLPTIVERIVQEEIKKITKRMI